MKPGWILFDWGNTLMVDFPEYEGPMAQWPQVAAVPHAREALYELRGKGWRTALATNAADSGRADIRAALARVCLDALIDNVYCSREVGHKKPSQAFFAFIRTDLKISSDELVMVGDEYQADVAGANNAGIRAIWLTDRGSPRVRNNMQRVVRNLMDLPQLLESWD